MEEGLSAIFFFSQRQQRKWHLEASRHKRDGDLEPIYSVSYHVSLESRALLVVRSVPTPAVASTFTANEGWQMMRWRLLMAVDACRDVSSGENPSRSAVQCWQQQQRCQLGLTSSVKVWAPDHMPELFISVTAGFEKSFLLMLHPAVWDESHRKKNEMDISDFFFFFFFAFNSQVDQSGYHYHVQTGRQFLNTWNGETISSEQQKPICTAQHTRKTNTPATPQRHCVHPALLFISHS